MIGSNAQDKKHRRDTARCREGVCTPTSFFLMSRESIDHSMVERVYLSTLEFRTRFPEPVDELVVVLDSSGGDIHSAYIIIKLLRKCCSKLTVVIPRWAKSAATLIRLAADEIAMTEVAEMGPLDPQVREPGAAYSRAVLDEYMALSALRQDTLATLDLVMPLIWTRTGIDLRELLEPITRFVAQLMAPVYNQIDPKTHGSHMRTMNISKDYAQRVLKRWGRMTDERAKDVAQQIVEGYPCHAFVIDLMEVRSLGLPGREVSAEEERELAHLIRLTQRFNFVGTLHEADQAAEVGQMVAASSETDASHADTGCRGGDDCAEDGEME